MEPLSSIELESLEAAGNVLQRSGAWAVAIEEIDRRMQGVITSALLGPLPTYEQYLQAQALYSALYQLKTLPESMIDQGATND